MRRLSVGLVAMSLVVGSVGPALAQAPTETESPSIDAGQRLEFDEPGFAVTIPAGWEVRPDASIFQDDGSTFWALASVGARDAPEQLCSFEGWRRSPGRWTFLAGADIEWLELPAGRTMLIDYSDPHEDGFYGTNVHYVFERGANSYVVDCAGTEPPEDHWLSIAASFEYLRNDHQIISVLPDVTMTFPIEWSTLEDRGQLAGAPGWEKVLWSTDGAGTCRVAYDTRATDPEFVRTPEELRAEYLDYLPQRAAGSIDPVVVDLPAGPAWRADWEAGTDAFVSDRSLYQIPIGETSLRVACHTSIADAPDDRWLSIAETIEFLPAEE